jgi:hypothetical protein
MRILKALWLLTRTIALSVIVDVSVAAAQTVIVRSAPPGAPIEIQVDGGRTQSVTADANGDATLSVALPSGSTEAAVQVFVDRCEPVVRVQLVRRGVPIPVAGAGCTRGDISGAYLMRSITTFVVDVDQSGGSVHVRQGPPPRSWLSRGELASGGRETFRWPAANGVTLWAGVGISRDSHRHHLRRRHVMLGQRLHRRHCRRCDRMAAENLRCSGDDREAGPGGD